MTSKMVALCLLRLLPRGGSRFRLWLQRKLCKAEFERQTRKLRAWRVFLMRDHRVNNDYAKEVKVKGIFVELESRIPRAHGAAEYIQMDNGGRQWQLLRIRKDGKKWDRWRLLHY